MTISQVAKRVGLRTSTLRYYEQIGLLEPTERVSGQRRYAEAVFYRLSIVQRAQQAGFTLDEIRELFSGFAKETSAPERWNQLSRRKLQELAVQMSKIQFMQGLLHDMMANCRCDTLETCGKALFHQIDAPKDEGVLNRCSPNSILQRCRSLLCAPSW